MPQVQTRQTAPPAPPPAKAPAKAKKTPEKTPEKAAEDRSRRTAAASAAREAKAAKKSRMPAEIQAALAKQEPEPPPPIQIRSATPNAQWVTITPALARKWLRTINTNNRSIRDDNTRKIADDMRAGKWIGRNGESIKFDTEGRLIDGQHRLVACTMADRDFETLMLTGVPTEAYRTLDGGAKRSYADYLGPVGHEKNVHLLAATVKLVYYWRKDKMALAAKMTTPSNAQMDDTLARFAGIRESVAWAAWQHDVRRLLTSSFVALLHFAGTHERRKEQMENFLLRLGDGVGLKATSPIYQLRKFLLEQRETSGLRARKVGQSYVLGLSIKAWNMEKAGEDVKRLIIYPNEEFPKL